MPRTDGGRRRCAIYTRKSSEEGLEQEFNSLAAQRDACEAYIRSHQHEGWVLARTRYDDGGFSGGTLQRPALQRLLADIRTGRIDIVVVYKVDRRCSRRATHPVTCGHERSTLSLLHLLDAGARSGRGPNPKLAASGAGDRRLRDQHPH